MDMDTEETEESVSVTGNDHVVEETDIPETEIGHSEPIDGSIKSINDPIGATGTDFPWPMKKLFSTPQQETGVHKKAVSYGSDCYNMGHARRGRALIINQQYFSPALRREGFSDRTGTMVDGKALKIQLKALDFDVQTYSDVSAKRMEKLLAEMAAEDHSNADCFVCAILSHGEEGIVYGTDESIEIKNLLKYFKGDKCTSLVGKPKIFFIQACRGSQLDEGAAVNVTDALIARDCDTTFKRQTIFRLPVEADFLIAYSTVPGYYSWRNGNNGSWFVQALAEMLATHGETVELLQLLTKVNQMVAQSFESNSNTMSFSKKKQIPCITSMLTKDVYFKRK